MSNQAWFEWVLSRAPKWYLYMGLNTQHGVFVCKVGMSSRLCSLLPLFQFKFLSFKNQRYRNISLLFPYFKIKETKDYVTSPRAWTCDLLVPFYVIPLGQIVPMRRRGLKVRLKWTCTNTATTPAPLTTGLKLPSFETAETFRAARNAGLPR